MVPFSLFATASEPFELGGANTDFYTRLLGTALGCTDWGRVRSDRLPWFDICFRVWFAASKLKWDVQG